MTTTTTKFEPLTYRVRRSQHTRAYYAQATMNPVLGWINIGATVYLTKWGAILGAYTHAYKRKWRHYHPKKVGPYGEFVTMLGKLP